MDGNCCQHSIFSQPTAIDRFDLRKNCYCKIIELITAECHLVALVDHMNVEQNSRPFLIATFQPLPICNCSFLLIVRWTTNEPDHEKHSQGTCQCATAISRIRLSESLVFSSERKCVTTQMEQD